MIDPNQQARADAQYNMVAERLRERLGPGPNRMAGAAMAATLAPGVVALMDDQETNILGYLASGAIGLGGLGAGMHVGYQQSQDVDAYIKAGVADLKKQSVEIAKKEGPAAAAQWFGEAKQQLMNEVNPIMPQAGLHRSPREVRSTVRGAMIGSALAAVPAYLAMRNGQVSEA